MCKKINHFSLLPKRVFLGLLAGFVIGWAGISVSACAADSSAAADAPVVKTWARLFHHLVARNLDFDPGRIRKFFYFSEHEAADLAAIPQPLTSPVALSDTPHLRIQQKFADPAVLDRNFAPFTSDKAPIDYFSIPNQPPARRPYVSKLFERGHNSSGKIDEVTSRFRALKSVIVIVPGMGSEYLPLIPFKEVVADYASRFPNYSEIIVARSDRATSNSRRGGQALVDFLRTETPLFRRKSYKKLSIIFVAYDQGINHVLDLLANTDRDPSRRKQIQEIVDRTKYVVSVGGLSGGLPMHDQLKKNSERAHYLAHELAVIGGFLADGNRALGFEHAKDSLKKSILALGGQANQLLDNLAPALSSLADPETTRRLSSQIQQAINSQLDVLGESLGKNRESAAGQLYSQTLKDYTHIYQDVLRDVGAALAELDKRSSEARTHDNLKKIHFSSARDPLVFFTIGAMANPTDFRLNPDVEFSGGKFRIVNREGLLSGFSWDEFLLYLVSQPGFFHDARFDGVVRYQDTLLDEPVATAANPDIKAVNLGLFRTDHFGLAVGGLLSKDHPFPRREVFEALLETMEIYQQGAHP